ncbi:hypothetical protein TMM008_04720 [Pseudomonas sp. 008]|nr:hypothetical protein TMM008_04720 [Pseudomonas sp. 008]
MAKALLLATEGLVDAVGSGNAFTHLQPAIEQANHSIVIGRRNLQFSNILGARSPSTQMTETTVSNQKNGGR